MHRPSLAVTLLALLILLLYTLFQPVQNIKSYEELRMLPENTKVSIQGTVLKQTFTKEISYLLLTNNLTLQIKGTRALHNQTIYAQGTVDTFKGHKIRVTTLKTIPIKEANNHA